MLACTSSLLSLRVASQITFDAESKFESHNIDNNAVIHEDSAVLGNVDALKDVDDMVVVSEDVSDDSCTVLDDMGGRVGGG